MAVIGNLKGPQGIQGVPGNDGNNGANGTNGTVWHHGTGVPSAQIGAKLAELTAAQIGDFYLNDANGDYYVKATAATVAWAD